MMIATVNLLFNHYMHLTWSTLSAISGFLVAAVVLFYNGFIKDAISDGQWWREKLLFEVVVPAICLHLVIVLGVIFKIRFLTERFKPKDVWMIPILSVCFVVVAKILKHGIEKIVARGGFLDFVVGNHGQTTLHGRTSDDENG